MSATQPSRRGRPPKIAENDIVEAVLAEGFAGLTVPAVAERLEVTTMTLYRHMPTRAHLLALAWNYVLDSHAWPKEDLSWRELLRHYSIDLWDLLAQHSGAVSEISGAVLPGRMVHLYDGLAEILSRREFSADAAVLAVDSVLDLAIDHRRGVENLEQVVEDGSERLRDQVGGLWNDEPTRVAQQDVRASMRRAIASEPRVWFERKLDLVLDGIASQRACPPTPATDVEEEPSA